VCAFAWLYLPTLYRLCLQRVCGQGWRAVHLVFAACHTSLVVAAPLILLFAGAHCQPTLATLQHSVALAGIAAAEAS
jgi:hypothetical protein